MNLAEAFVGYLESIGIGTYNEDLFISKAPSSDQGPDSLWWIVASGGQPTLRAATGESRKEYQVSIFYRNRSAQAVYDALFSLEEELNCAGCIELTGFDALGIEATSFPVDQDLDSEDRSVGLVQVTVRTYKSCTGVS